MGHQQRKSHGWQLGVLIIVALVCSPAIGTPSKESPGAGSRDDSSPQSAVQSSIADFYRVTGSEPIWIEAPGLSEKGHRFVRLLENIDSEGLDAKDYWYDEILALSRETDLDWIGLWRLELLLDLSYLSLGKDLIQGRADWNLHDPRWHIPRNRAQLADLAAALNSTIPIDHALRALAPGHSAYHQLKEALARYREIEKAGGWDPIETNQSLKPGMENATVSIVRRRLVLEGDLEERDEGSPFLYDEQLVQGVKAFQRRHGLEEDGVVGRKTREVMNIPVSERVRQIQMNLERWRWLPRELGNEYIMVNTASFRLDYVRNAETALTMRVIVGDQLHRTPVFMEKMTYIDINPVWNVPQKIATEEILPQLAMKPDYLERKGFRILSDWSPGARELTLEETGWSTEGGGHFPYRLQQAAGDQNALGKIKFLLPNRYNIYLHDTPGKSLFSKPRRTFSHGCIRLENPKGLAVALFEQLKKWDEERLEQLLAEGVNSKAILARPVPVYIVYFSSWVDESGAVYFSRDHYHRDRALVRHLFPGEEISY
ncbi:MAG: L,D-transpeptidase family protein [Sedimenticola sp.]